MPCVRSNARTSCSSTAMRSATRSSRGGPSDAAIRAVPLGPGLEPYRHDVATAAAKPCATRWDGRTRRCSSRRAPGSLATWIRWSRFAQVARRTRRSGSHCWATAPLRAALDARASALGLSARVLRPGRIAERDLPVWHRVGGHLRPPSSPCDGTSVSLLEAMASERPVVVHFEHGNTEWVRQGENGWLVDCRSAASIAAGLREAIASAGQLAGDRIEPIANACSATRTGLAIRFALTDAFQRATRAAAERRRALRTTTCRGRLGPMVLGTAQLGLDYGYRQSRRQAGSAGRPRRARRGVALRRSRDRHGARLRRQ